MIPEWQENAACSGKGARIFFQPINEETGGRDQSWTPDEAKLLCSRCTVQPQCLEWALNEPGLDYGILAGLNADERRKLRRQLDIKLRRADVYLRGKTAAS